MNSHNHHPTNLSTPTKSTTMKSFQSFSQAIHTRYTDLAKRELFVVGTDKNAVSDVYLASFPEGTNPIYKTNTEHDCTCCKNWLRNLGNVVAIVDGQVVTMWDDFGLLPYPYNVVAEKMRDYIRGLPITGLFRAQEAQYGNEFTLQGLEDGSAKRWHHLHGRIQAKHKTNDVGTVVGVYNTAVQVFRRGLDELTQDALDQVAELITSKALYRGEEHAQACRTFNDALRAYHAYTAQEKELFVWLNAGQPFARFRNTVIGTLVQDLSEGVGLEVAVKAFEAKVAPANYKRPTALITPRMVQDAMKTITEMGLEPALERRFAKISDVTVNNVLWVDNTVKGKMKGGIEGLLMHAAQTPMKADTNAPHISIETFMRDILPSAVSIDMLVQNNHEGNFMSLTAPVHADTGGIFKWSNDFAWSYAGNVADSIKERVKKAGGKVEGDVCCRLSWDNTSDLDFHMFEPVGSGHINFATYLRTQSPNGGTLDLDANGRDGARQDPAENIVYEDAKKMRDGVYQLGVCVYSKRDSGHKDFEVEIEVGGTLHYFRHTKPWTAGDMVRIADLTKRGADITVKPLLDGSVSRPSKTIWGVKTEQFVKVQTVMFSPNYWDDNAVGNKHYLFMLDGCKNPEPTRGIYNEFLNAALDKHRKVFEIIGDKTKCAVTDEQLSGLGFSSTKGGSVTVKVTTATSTRVYSINF